MTVDTPQPRGLFRLNRNQWWRLVWLPPILAGAFYMSLKLFELEFAFLQLWLVAVTGVFLAALIAVAKQEPFPEPRRRAAPDLLVQDRPFADVSRWEDRLAWSQGDLQRFHHTVQRRLSALIAERLRLRHGVSIAAHPQHAREILGDGLYLLATTPIVTPLSGYELEYIVHSIEEI